MQFPERYSGNYYYQTKDFYNNSVFFSFYKRCDQPILRASGLPFEQTYLNQNLPATPAAPAANTAEMLAYLTRFETLDEEQLYQAIEDLQTYE
ncbi:hypothetical protein [Alkalicoccus daliensis]|uniref:Uncharacterized protein n=1 Tax=Alkalicoccus daliensis TaxID=745820 RepID=A0A1H0F5K4_9BACI|nr:hypothetical protein [Alkalicoccus daliensis]SDN89940.1 hypothetical protein SAMN04488053_104199 [Alkalicoccus daliensis]